MKSNKGRAHLLFAEIHTIKFILRNMAKEIDQEFVEFIIKSIVEHPDDVKVNRTIDERGVLLTVDVHPEDMGQVIGRQGSTAKAIRTLLRIIGVKSDARLNLKINEPEGGRGPAPRREEQVSPVAPSAPAEEQKPVEDVVDELKL